MVAVIGGPSQRQLRQVARTHHESAQLIAEVHQNLRTLTSLTVLVGHVMDIRVVADVLEMLRHRLGNAYLAHGDAQALHQADGIAIGAAGGAKARHGDANDALAVVAQFIEGLYAYQQGQGGVETTTDADNHLLAVGVGEALGQSRHLNIKNLFTALLHHVVRGDEGMRVDPAVWQQRGRHGRDGLIDRRQTVHKHLVAGATLIAGGSLCIDEGGVATAF